MIQDQRILFNDDGTENDLSISLNDFRSKTAAIPFVAAEDKIYIASVLPFNHKYFLIDTANDGASVPSVDIWFSQEWKSAVDVLDRTDSSGVTFAGSEVIQWKTDRDFGWDREEDSEDVSGIDAVGIYNMYWMRLSFSADLNALVLKYVGHKFSSDEILYSYYPDLDNQSLRTAFDDSNKTTWDEQHFMAADIIIQDLTSRNIIVSRDQILDYELFSRPSVHKVAEIIYRGLGKDFDEDRKLSKQYYTDSLNIKQYKVDLNKDGNINDKERTNETGFMTR